MQNNKWYLLVGLVAILGIVGIVYWLYKTEHHLWRRLASRELVAEE